MVSCEQATGPGGGTQEIPGHNVPGGPGFGDPGDNLPGDGNDKPGNGGVTRPPLDGDLIDVQFPVVSPANGISAIVDARYDMMFQIQQMYHRFTNWTPSNQAGRDFRDAIISRAPDRFGGFSGAQPHMQNTYETETNGQYLTSMLHVGRGRMTGAISDRLGPFGSYERMRFTAAISALRSTIQILERPAQTPTNSSQISGLNIDLRDIGYLGGPRIPRFTPASNFLTDADRQALEGIRQLVHTELVNQTETAMENAGIEIPHQLILDIWAQVADIDQFSAFVSLTRASGVNVDHLPLPTRARGRKLTIVDNLPLPTRARGHKLTIIVPEMQQEEAPRIAEQRVVAGIRL